MGYKGGSTAQDVNLLCNNYKYAVDKPATP